MSKDYTMMNAFSNNRKLFVAANWKCSIESPMDADRLIESMNDEWLTLDENLQDCVEVSIHPPYCFLDRVSKGLDPSMAVGSQNMYDASFPNQGNTGATTCKMLSGLGCNWVLLGHSDRRNNLGESDELIAQKAALALEEGLGIVLTLGEKKEERDAGQELAVLRKQLLTVADAIPNDADTWSQVVLAYEPVWAVGEGATPCAPDEAQRIHAALRQYIRKHVSEGASEACRITYTGSVNPENAKGYAQLPDVDGFVVGRAGLDAQKLGSILKTLFDTKTKLRQESQKPESEMTAKELAAKRHQERMRQKQFRGTKKLLSTGTTHGSSEENRPQFLDKDESEMTPQELAAKRHYERTDQRRANMEEKKQKQANKHNQKPYDSYDQSLTLSMVMRRSSVEAVAQQPQLDEKQLAQKRHIERMKQKRATMEPRQTSTLPLKINEENENDLDEEKEMDAQPLQLDEKQLAKKRHKERMEQKRANMEDRQPFTLPKKIHEENENDLDEKKDIDATAHASNLRSSVAAEAMSKMEEIGSSTATTPTSNLRKGIDMTKLDDKLADALKPLDLDGDQFISVEEVIEAARLVKKEHTQNKRLRRIVTFQDRLLSKWRKGRSRHQQEALKHLEPADEDDSLDSTETPTNEDSAELQGSSGSFRESTIQCSEAEPSLTLTQALASS